MYALSSHKSKGWLIFGGIISVLVGFFAILSPYIFSFVITQLIGAFCLVTGVISLVQSLFGKHQAHRLYSGLSGIVRIAAGVALMFFPVAGAAALTLILAILFLVEAIASVVAAFKMKGNRVWIWLLLNGIVAGILAVMIYSKWPLDALWMIGLLFGIQAIFSGVTMVLLGFQQTASN